ncbi:nitrilase-related carbon-nitrogen hydrolase [Hydrogenoanaerobacterium sp.]|uniref:nitrilase-related carbon-nitrogen hydrolase n=1 Tax=Hydrogenoanaerobacterium sp. TaxID=2953763 RepID=UPI00289A8BA4|nr:nitrilase-related carbon-nitrogen hydrolase [Hydrogenoanaerobacterium sp.]
MQDLFLNIIDAFASPAPQSNFVVFKNSEPVLSMKQGGSYFKKCKKYAKEYNTYVVTGLMNIADFLCVCMFDPNGKLAGAQRALFFTRDNRDLYKKASNLALFDTPYGKVFLCVDADIYNPEVQRHARLGGCEILVSSQWIAPNEYNDQKLFTGGWGAAQTNNFLVLSANNNTASVSAPFLATMDNTGFVVPPAQTASATFNVSRLCNIHSNYYSSHFNHELYAAHRKLL